MKFEKITNNKIKILFSVEDMNLYNVSTETFLSDYSEFQDIIQNLLIEAEKQIDFKTDDCKLMLESLMDYDGGFTFTITKLSSELDKNSLITSSIVLKLESLDSFLNLCTYISNMESLVYQISSSIFSLYCYNNEYYLCAFSAECSFPDLMINVFMEFGKFIPFSEYLEGTLHEYGKLIFKDKSIINLIK